MGLSNWLKSALGTGETLEIPKAEVERVTQALEHFCEKAVPERVRDKLWYSYGLKGHRVSLVEQRPHFMDPKKTTQMVIAVFEYQGDERWRLLWADRNSRWQEYEGFESVTFEQALEEVTSDPTGIFFG